MQGSYDYQHLYKTPDSSNLPYSAIIEGGMKYYFL